MNGYSETPTRDGHEGALDKLVLVNTLADEYSEDRGLHEEILRKISHAPSGADEQVWAWETFVNGLPYRRESQEIFRDPRQTIKVGGDCDDLVLLFLTGCKVLAIPCVPEIMATEDGEGFHIRARVGLPPLAPTEWVVVDPVYRSEPQWAMHNTTDGSAYLRNKQAAGQVGALSSQTLSVLRGLHGTTSSKRGSSRSSLLPLATAAALIWWSSKR